MTDQQPELFQPETHPQSPAEQAQRDVYRRRLAEYLKDPQFRAIEGFPIGTDEDILALSDPPYYTACPNPFLLEIISEWQQERKEIRQKLGLKEESYQRDPFAADVSEGKNDTIYNAHSYHTKVPHKAIMRYILHYTDPGDIVYDGFCGTGMTGVAAQLCGDKKAVEELGFRVDEDGIIWDDSKAISNLGERRAILNDLSSAATFIAYNYNTPVNAVTFEREASLILRDVEQECGWMYETWHPNCDAPNRVKGKINYTVWSDMFVCPNCGQEMVFWNVAVDVELGQVRDAWQCPSCRTLLSKTPSEGSGALKAERAWDIKYDKALQKTIKRIKQAPVVINYSLGKRRFEKTPDLDDIAKIQKIEEQISSNPFPTNPLTKGDKTGDPINAGVTNVHHFFTLRNLYVLASLRRHIGENATNKQFLCLIGDLLPRASRMHKIAISRLNTNLSKTAGILTGTLYIPSNSIEYSVLEMISFRIQDIVKYQKIYVNCSKNLVNTSSSTQTLASTNSLDNIFVDPPFGYNLMYSELNFLWESWLKVITNNSSEAIVNNSQNKKLRDYQKLMENCFAEFHRLLKAGRWMTVEFHNSQNMVWNAIQEALQRAGFVVADVRTFDKQQGSYNQYNAQGAVKQDLIISAYKPNVQLEERFQLEAGTEEGVWDFIRYHLGKLPILNIHQGNLINNAERQAFLLFDRMVAFHIQRGVMVPMSSPEFYAGLEQRFTRRDGMYFLPDQVEEYDRVLLNSGKLTQIPLFVTNEKTAIIWLRQQLNPGEGGEPQTRGDLTNPFNQTMHRAKHEKALELIEILEQNFLQDEAGRWYVPDHNKASDLEKVRQRALLREFNEYDASTGRLRQFRTEAVRAGFADCFKRQEYGTIVSVAERLPEDVLREDPDLLMYYDSALLRKKA